MRPLGFSEVLDGAMQLFRRDFGLYYLIVLVCSLPYYVLSVVWNPAELLEGVEALESADDPTIVLGQFDVILGQLGYVIGISLVALAFSFFAKLSLTVAMADRIEERPSSLGAAFKGALPRLPRAAGATIVAFLIFLFIFFVVWIATLVLAAGITVATNSPWLGVIGFAIMAAMLLLVFFFWQAVTFGILPAVVIEGRTAMDALARSLSLCKGGWLRVIGIMVVASIVSWAPGMAITSLTGTWELFTSPADAATISATRQWLLNTANLVVTPLVAPFAMGCIMMLFHDRRVRTEAYDLEHMADEMGAASP